jgi:hypothetical protein
MQAFPTRHVSFCFISVLTRLLLSRNPHQQLRSNTKSTWRPTMSPREARFTCNPRYIGPRNYWTNTWRKRKRKNERRQKLPPNRQARKKSDPSEARAAVPLVDDRTLRSRVASLLPLAGPESPRRPDNFVHTRTHTLKFRPRRVDRAGVGGRQRVAVPRLCSVVS